jgi:hypothetical protein
MKMSQAQIDCINGLCGEYNWKWAMKGYCSGSGVNRESLDYVINDVVCISMYHPGISM